VLNPTTHYVKHSLLLDDIATVQIELKQDLMMGMDDDGYK
jgi:hypothetical protein